MGLTSLESVSKSARVLSCSSERNIIMTPLLYVVSIRGQNKIFTLEALKQMGTNRQQDMVAHECSTIHCYYMVNTCNL